MVTAELNLGVPLEVDLAHERFGLTPDVRRNGDALPHDRLPAQWGSGSLCPLREARADLPIGVKKTHGLAFTGEKLLEQGSVPETRHCLDCVPSLIGIDHESRTDPCSLASVRHPRLARLDHGWESNFVQRPSHVPRRPRDRTVTNDCLVDASSTKASNLMSGQTAPQILGLDRDPGSRLARQR